MSKSQEKNIRRVIAMLEKARAIADDEELTLGNGAEVGGMIGCIADELACRIEEATNA